ncbi:MAG: HIT family protein [Patescibacteria group bacterium]
MSDCLFCKIINKEIPSSVVYEDEKIIAFLDIKPVNPGHTLVVPKKHSTQLLDADDETLREMFSATRKIAQAVVLATGAPGFNLEVNCGPVAGQIIQHLHLHIVPRREDDGLKHWPGHEYPAQAAEEMAQKIRQTLNV